MSTCTQTIPNVRSNSIGFMLFCKHTSYITDDVQTKIKTSSLPFEIVLSDTLKIQVDAEGTLRVYKKN
jgi:hypothetical protein